MRHLKKVVKFQAPLDLLKETARLGRLPVVNFAAGGLATPADCSLLMQLGVDGCFVGSGIFSYGITGYGVSNQGYKIRNIFALTYP